MPKYLVMENVPTLLSPRHIDNFNKWKEQLRDLGYISKEVPLNARYFGIPQNRPRLLMLSIYVGNDIYRMNIIQAYLDEFYAKLSLKVTKQSDGQKIYWTAKQNPDDYSDCRAGKTDADKRDSKDIPIIEAANAVYKIVSDQIALSPDDLAKEAAKQLGFSRLGTNLTTLMDAAVEYNKAAGYLTTAENGNITVKKTEN